MKNWLEVVHQTDIPAMFSKLRQVYFTSLGIEMQEYSSDFNSSEPDIEYLLHDPQKFQFLNSYRKNFILDPSEDMPEIVAEYCGHIVTTLNDVELRQLLLAIEDNRIRQSINESGVDIDNITQAVNRFLDTLYVAVAARMRLIDNQTHQKGVDTIAGIITTSDSTAMFEKLIAFYHNELGIALHEQSSDEDSDDIRTVLAVEDDYKKIEAHGVQLKHKPNLDTDDLVLILETYFKPIIASFRFDDLFQIGLQTKALNDSLGFSDHMDFQLARYIGPLHGAIKDQLNAKVENLLQQPGITVHNLALIVNHMDLLTEQGADDIQDYLDSLSATLKIEQENLPNSTLRAIIKEKKTEEYFTRINQMWLMGSENLIEACDLKSYVTLLQIQEAGSKLPIGDILNRLTATIEDGFRKLLQDYKKDVASTISDLNRTQKLKCINKMLDSLDDPKASSEEKMKGIKILFDHNPGIHNTESIGRQLYRIICAFLKRPSQIANYHMTLFKGLSDQDREETKPDLKHRYRN